VREATEKFEELEKKYEDIQRRYDTLQELLALFITENYQAGAGVKVGKLFEMFWGNKA
jgi:hypothetical protein